MTNVGYGTAPNPDDPYVVAADSFSPIKSLERVATSARFTVGAVSVVGVTLTGLGLVGVRELSAKPVPRGLAIAAVVLSILAVVLALMYTIVRVDTVSIGNFAAVEKYIKRQFKRARLATIASVLLVVSVVLAGTSAVAGLLLSGEPMAIAELGVAKSGANQSVTGRAQVRSLDAGDRAALTIRAYGVGTPVIVYASRAMPDRDGIARIDASVRDLPKVRVVSLEVAVNGVVLTHTEVPAVVTS